MSHPTYDLYTAAVDAVDAYSDACGSLQASSGDPTETDALYGLGVASADFAQFALTGELGARAAARIKADEDIDSF
jgi:hypothetical protein